MKKEKKTSQIQHYTIGDWICWNKSTTNLTRGANTNCVTHYQVSNGATVTAAAVEP